MATQAQRQIQSTQSISSNPANQAVFAQQKLEKIYQSAHRWLTPYKAAIEFAQEVLLWKKKFAAALLFGIVHLLFMYVW